jgi:hypothetical protein
MGQQGNFEEGYSGKSLWAFHRKVWLPMNQVGWWKNSYPTISQGYQRY